MWKGSIVIKNLQLDYYLIEKRKKHQMRKVKSESERF